MWKALIVALAGVAAGALAGCSNSPTTGGRAAQEGGAPRTGKEKGAADARHDIQNGILKVKSEPLPDAPWWNDYTRLLQERCKVETEVVNDYEKPGVKEEMEGYNAVMKEEIQKRFGPDIFKTLTEEAQKKK